jgi:hypothetical protein
VIVSDPVKAEAVPKWMCIAEQIATGSRPRVLEDGSDTIHSDDEAKKDVEPDVELNTYAAGADPKLGPTKLSQHEVARQRAVAQALKAQASGSQSSCSESDNPNGFDMRWSHSRQTFVKNAAKDLSDSDIGNSIIPSPVSSPEPTRQPTPLTSPTNSDDEGMSEDQRRLAENAQKRASKGARKQQPQPPRCTSAPGTRAPPKSVPAKEPHGVGNPAFRSRAEAGPSQRVPEPPKAADSPRAPADKSKNIGMGQESPGTKVPAHDPHPNATRLSRRASGAGSLRPGGRLGPTDTCVDLFNPSKT